MKCKVVRGGVDDGEALLNDTLAIIEGLGATVKAVSSAVWGDGFDAHIVYTVLYEDPTMIVEGSPSKFLAS